MEKYRYLKRKVNGAVFEIQETEFGATTTASKDGIKYHGTWHYGAWDIAIRELDLIENHGYDIFSNDPAVYQKIPDNILGHHADKSKSS